MCCRVLIVAPVAARILFEQALPPARAIGQPENTSALLAQASEKVLSSLHRLPKYTCLETVERSYYVLPYYLREKHATLTLTEAPPVACLGSHTGQLFLEATDRVRVEVAAAGGREIHSWPAANHFDTGPIDQLVPFGPLSTGSFGTNLFDVFANPGTEMNFSSRELTTTGDVFRYSFRVPANVSHYFVKGTSGWRVSAFSGSFGIQAQTAELTRLVLETDDLPTYTGMCRARISTDYHIARIGDGEFLIPQRSGFHTFDVDGGETDSVTEFSACREYTAESRLSFDEQDTPGEIVKTKPKHGIAIPPGISLTLALVGPIDLSTAAAGDPVSARVVHLVRAPKSKEVLVPANSLARGRILVMRHEYLTSEYQMSIRFDTLEREGAVSPLSVRLDREIKAAKRNAKGFSIRGTEFSLPAPASMDPESHFSFPAKRHPYVIRAGFQSKWTTVAP
jgi:hypothetical protein